MDKKTIWIEKQKKKKLNYVEMVNLQSQKCINIW